MLYLAAQVAVTTRSPEDFENNALGAFNVRDAVADRKPRKLFHQFIHQQSLWQDERYRRRRRAAARLPFAIRNVSKGAADQYAIDYARIYGIHSVTVRQIPLSYNGPGFFKNG